MGNAHESGAPDLATHRVLIDACLRHGVYFLWRGAGTLLISGKGVTTILRDVIPQGHVVLGCEGFELDGAVIHPRLDLIFLPERRPDVADPCDVIETWPEEIWVDVYLAES